MPSVVSVLCETQRDVETVVKAFPPGLDFDVFPTVDGRVEPEDVFAQLKQELRVAKQERDAWRVTALEAAPRPLLPEPWAALLLMGLCFTALCFLVMTIGCPA